MNLFKFIFAAIFIPGTLFAEVNPAKLYSNIYDGVIYKSNVDSISFFRKDTDVVVFDWNTKNEKNFHCGLTKHTYSAYMISSRDSIYLLTQTNAPTSEMDAWILDLSGTCFKISELVQDFPGQTAVWDLVYYSEKLKQVIIPSSDYRIAPRDGHINVFINPKTKTIINKTPGYFRAGINSVQDDSKAYTVIGRNNSYALKIYNLNSFTLDKTVQLGDLYISEIYLDESKRLGLRDNYLISGAIKGQTFLGYYNKTTDQITKAFENPCYTVQFFSEFNLALCYDTPPGGPWDYYTQNLTNGERSLIWNDLWHEPKLSKKNSLIVANKQNGQFSFYNIKTKEKSEFYTGTKAGEFFFFDKDEKNIISVSHNWSGVVTIEKFLVSDPTKLSKLYELNIPSDDDFGFVQYDISSKKLFIPLHKGGAYYLDVH